ncbi:MAG TPA: hypothetical protein VMB26_12520 [Candidatus Binataceae bacterium]|nr:hypothetical protein [Candidatus Binataceae bacterium]
MVRLTALVKAIALGLLAWYLMIPPPAEISSDLQTNFSAPLAQWDELRRFDSSSQCEAVRKAYAQKPPGAISDMLGGKQQALATMTKAQCVKGDDPRLKQQ